MRVRCMRAKRCRPLICDTCADKSEPGNGDKGTAPVHAFPLQCSTSAYPSAAVSRCTQFQCPNQSRTSPCLSEELLLAKPAWRATVLTSKAAFRAQYIAPVRSRLPQRPRYMHVDYRRAKKTKTKKQVGGVSLSGRGSVARLSGEPLAPSGARDELVQVKKILPP